jgi:hypothetical protein
MNPAADSLSEATPIDLNQFTPLPGSSGFNPGSVHSSPSTSLTPVVCDERAISRLLGSILSRAGLTTIDIAMKMGVTPQSVRQYLAGRRCRPGLLWFIKFAELAGARVVLEWPERPKGGR